MPSYNLCGLQPGTLSPYVSQLRDAYAKESLAGLKASTQADLLGWAEAHAILSALFREGVLRRFAARAPAHWEGNSSVSRASVLETLLTAQTSLVLQTATYIRQTRSTQTDTITSTPSNGHSYCIYASFQEIIYKVRNNEPIPYINNTNQSSRRYFGKASCAGLPRARRRIGKVIHSKFIRVTG